MQLGQSQKRKKSVQSGCVLVGWDPLCAHFHPANVLPGREENYSTINTCCGRAPCLLVTQRSLCVVALAQPSEWKEKWIDLHRCLSLIWSFFYVRGWCGRGFVFTFQLFTFTLLTQLLCTGSALSTQVFQFFPEINPCFQTEAWQSVKYLEKMCCFFPLSIHLFIMMVKLCLVLRLTCLEVDRKEHATSESWNKHQPPW